MIGGILLAAVTTLSPREFSALPLSNALQHAVTLSPDVAQARERVNENAALLAAARSGASPALIANYSNSPQGIGTNQTAQQSLTTVGAQVVLGDYLAYSPLVRQAAFTLSAAQYDYINAQRDERIKVIGEYYTALKAAATLDLNMQSLQSVRRDLAAAQLRYRAGDAPRLDVVRSQVAVTGAQAAVDSARVDLANAEDALATETGMSMQSFRNLRPAAGSSDPPPDADRAVTRALAQRSDLASAQLAVRGEEAAVRAAQRSIFPAVTLQAGYTSGIDSGQLVHGPSVNANLALPISHEARDRTNAERARLAQAQYKAAAIERQIRLDVAAAARTYEQSISASQAAARARVEADQELRATELGYRSGASSSLDVSVAQRTYQQAALNELSAVYAQVQAAAVLQEDIGP
jgi:outer membrane protein